MNTKTQREKEQKDRLRQRVTDIALGANGGCSLDACDVEGECFVSMGAEVYFDFITALSRIFPAPDNTAVYALWQLHKFATIDSTVEHLWKRGIRP